MFWRVLLLLLKPAALTVLFELLSPVAEAIGLHLGFVRQIALMVSQAVHFPAQECEVAVVFAVATVLVKLSTIAWDLATL
ncbi:MAG TPA: hypothetical protein VJ732_10590 [Bryobacteraceae bacterium]|nr:hypothetical protein [Bryobacteraceae bacterium]